MAELAGERVAARHGLALVIVCFVVVEVALLRTLLGITILAAVATALALRHAPPRQVRRGLIVAGVVMLVAAAIPFDVAFQRTGRPSVDVRPILWGHGTARAEASIRAGEVLLAGDLPPFYPPRYAFVISW